LLSKIGYSSILHPVYNNTQSLYQFLSLLPTILIFEHLTCFIRWAYVIYQLRPKGEDFTFERWKCKFWHLELRQLDRDSYAPVYHRRDRD